jgi:NADH-quinone oxidoreductase subunit G
VLGNLLGLSGFNFESVEEVRHEALGGGHRFEAQLAAQAEIAPLRSALELTNSAATPLPCERLADLPIYSADTLVRRSPALQATADGAAPCATLSTELWQSLGLAVGDQVQVSQGEGSVCLPAKLDPHLAPTVVRVPTGHPDTLALGPMFGPLQVAKA